MKDDERKTSLRGSEVIDKCSPQIERRGRIDSLTARAVLTCAYAEHFGYDNIVSGCKDIVRVMRELTRAEAKDEEPDVKTILGMSLDELRKVSYSPKAELGLDHYIPDENCDLMTAHLNVLRTDVREVELAFCCAKERSRVNDKMQIILNRLSSAVYILMLESRSDRI